MSVAMNDICIDTDQWLTSTWNTQAKGTCVSFRLDMYIVSLCKYFT